MLNRALKSAGIEREACVVTNVVNAKPPHDEWHLHPPGAVAAGVAALQALCRREQPSLIVALGEHALHTLIAGDPDAKQFRITEARGYCFPSPFGPVLAATHPAFILRNWHPWWPLFCYDLQKARRVHEEALGGGWKGGVSRTRAAYHEELLTEPPSSAAAWTMAPCLAVDSEHNGRDIACLGWSVSPDCGFAAPWREDFFPFFRELLDSPTPKVLQNGASDEYVLNQNGFELRNYAEELMLEWHSLEPLLAGKVAIDTEDSGRGRSHKSLLFFGSLLTDESWWKDYSFETAEDKWTLCARDARITLECHHKLQERLHVL